MPQRHRRPYSEEFRRQMVELVRAGREPEQLAQEFEPSAESIRKWVKQADRDAGRREDGLTTAERDELRRLRREVRQLREDREIGPAPVWWTVSELCDLASPVVLISRRRRGRWAVEN